MRLTHVLIICLLLLIVMVATDAYTPYLESYIRIRTYMTLALTALFVFVSIQKDKQIQD